MTFWKTVAAVIVATWINICLIYGLTALGLIVLGVLK